MTDSTVTLFPHTGRLSTASAIIDAVDRVPTLSEIYIVRMRALLLLLLCAGCVITLLCYN